MDQQQYELIKGIIEVDCYGQRHLMDGNGLTCAVGGLYTAINPDFPLSPYTPGTLEQFEEVQEVFGLSREQLREIAMQNDVYSNRDTRIKHILEYLAGQVEGEN